MTDLNLNDLLSDTNGENLYHAVQVNVTKAVKQHFQLINVSFSLFLKQNYGMASEVLDYGV